MVGEYHIDIAFYFHLLTLTEAVDSFMIQNVLWILGIIICDSNFVLDVRCRSSQLK